MKPSKKNFMKLILILAALVAAAVMFSGCKTTDQRAAYTTAATINVTVEGALAAYNELAKQGKTTLAQNQQVAAAFEKYKTAMLVLCDIGITYSTYGSTNTPTLSGALQTATLNASAAIADFVALTKSFGIKL